MQRPDHRKAEKVANEKRCPECNARLTVNKDGAYIDCTGCDWLGWSYEHVGALS